MRRKGKALLMFVLMFVMLTAGNSTTAEAGSKFTSIKITEENFPDKNLRAEIKKADKNKDNVLTWSEFHKAFYTTAEGTTSYYFRSTKNIKNTKGMELLPLDIVDFEKYTGEKINTKNMSTTVESLYIHTTKKKGEIKISLPNVESIHVEYSGMNEMTIIEETKEYRIEKAKNNPSKVLINIKGCEKLTYFGAFAVQVDVEGVNACTNLTRLKFDTITNTGELNFNKLKKLKTLEIQEFAYPLYSVYDLINYYVDEEYMPTEISKIDLSELKKLECVHIGFTYGEDVPTIILNKKYENKFVNEDWWGDTGKRIGLSYSKKSNGENGYFSDGYSSYHGVFNLEFK